MLSLTHASKGPSVWASLDSARPAAAGLSSYSAVTSSVSADELLPAHAALAAASAGVSVAEALLTGQQSHADRFQRGIRTLLDDGGWNAPTWRIDAAFAVFGSLPLVGVTFDDAYVLLDTVNGALAGPFALSSSLNAVILLSAHADVPVTSSDTRYFGIEGCPRTIAGDWNPYPVPAGWPAMPPWPTHPPIPPAVVGPPKYDCYTNSTSHCTCHRERRVVCGTGLLITIYCEEQEQCIFTPGNPGAPASCPPAIGDVIGSEDCNFFWRKRRVWF